jgi:hypothetical protein
MNRWVMFDMLAIKLNYLSRVTIYSLFDSWIREYIRTKVFKTWPLFDARLALFFPTFSHSRFLCTNLMITGWQSKHNWATLSLQFCVNSRIQLGSRSGNWVIIRVRLGHIVIYIQIILVNSTLDRANIRKATDESTTMAKTRRTPRQQKSPAKAKATVNKMPWTTGMTLNILPRFHNNWPRKQSSPSPGI